jgi:hypothetical protein
MATRGLMERVCPGIMDAPLYFVSTHGFYDFAKYTAEEIPMMIKIPENTIVIETSNIGEYAYFVNVFKAMRGLLSDRSALLAYLSGFPPATDSPAVKQARMACLKACHIYVAGMPISNRILEFTGGIFRQGASMESERTGDYSLMGFYRYDARGGEPTPILPEVRTRLIEQAYTDPSAFETYQTIFEDHIPSVHAGGPKIIFFSSCGEIKGTDSKAGLQVNAPVIEFINELQDTADAHWSSTIGRSIASLSAAANATVPKPVDVGEFVGRQKTLASVVKTRAAVAPLAVALRARAASSASGASEGGRRRRTCKARRTRKSALRSSQGVRRI